MEQKVCKELGRKENQPLVDLEPKRDEEAERNKVVQLKEEGNMILNHNGHNIMEILVQNDHFKMDKSNQE